MIFYSNLLQIEAFTPAGLRETYKLMKQTYKDQELQKVTVFTRPLPMIRKTVYNTEKWSFLIAQKLSAISTVNSKEEDFVNPQPCCGNIFDEAEPWVSHDPKSLSDTLISNPVNSLFF